MSLTKEDAVEVGLDMLSNHSNVKFFELRVAQAGDLEHVAEILRRRGCQVEVDEASLTLRVFALRPYVRA